MAEATTTRPTLRDLPLPAKLVVSMFLISVGLGYLWAMAQIHFKHASPGNPMPTVSDLVGRFSGVPWPLEPRPETPPAEKSTETNVAFKKPALRVKTVFEDRCVRCHSRGKEKSDAPLVTFDNINTHLRPKTDAPKGKLHKQLQGNRDDYPDNMVAVFFEESADWKNLSPEQRKTEEPKREAERRALLAWIEAGPTREQYDADRFPLPPGFDWAHLPARLLVETDAEALATNRGAPRPKPAAEKKPIDRWQEAKERQINVEALTQSTHAHLLSFSMLWALTGITFAFTSYSCRLRCLLSPLVLLAQVLDIACWWLARLDGPGPYFALAIMATGAIVALGLGAQIVLSLFNMYGNKGKLILVALFVVFTTLFGVTYIKVIKPQLDAEKNLLAQE